MPPNDTLLIDHCLAHPLSEKFPPAENGSKYKDPQIDSVQRMKDLGTLVPNRRPPSNPSIQVSGTLWKRRL